MRRTRQLPRRSRARSQTLGAPVPGGGGRRSGPPGSGGGRGRSGARPHCSAGPVSAHKGGEGTDAARSPPWVPRAQNGGGEGRAWPGSPPAPPRVPAAAVGGVRQPARLCPARLLLLRAGVPTWPVPLRGGGRGGSCRAFLPHPGEAGGLRGAHCAAQRSRRGTHGAFTTAPVPREGNALGFRTFSPIFPCNFLVWVVWVLGFFCLLDFNSCFRVRR